jgi:SAM-dependent methyltransferase
MIREDRSLSESSALATCAVCGGREFETVCSAREIGAQMDFLRRFHRRRLRPPVSPEAMEERGDFTQDYAARIAACRRCGLILRHPRPKPEEILRLYAQDEYGEERLNQLFRAQTDLYRRKARSLRRLLPDGARVIEAGSFVGGFLAAGRERGWEVTGVDPGAEVTDFCQSKGLPVFRGTLEEAPFGAESVDAVVIWNTFDQLPEPGPALDAARRLLRPGGLLTLRIPNGESFRFFSSRLSRFRREHGPAKTLRHFLLLAMAWNNLLAFPYLYGYSTATLDRLLSPHGFRRIGSTPDTLVRLSDEKTKLWAAWEERVVKTLLKGMARAEGRLTPSRCALAPWLDLFYRKGMPGDTRM